MSKKSTQISWSVPPTKFFGPHLGVVYVRRALGDKLVSTRVMAGDNTEMPLKMETGTLAMELVNGAAEAVEFIADCGRRHAEQLTDELEGLSGLRRDIVAGLRAFWKSMKRALPIN